MEGGEGRGTKEGGGWGKGGEEAERKGMRDGGGRGQKEGRGREGAGEEGTTPIHTAPKAACWEVEVGGGRWSGRWGRSFPLTP